MAQAHNPLVVAVSGGIDSVVLLDMLRRGPAPLIVAHVDHGIRSDGDQDEALVRSLASEYDLPYETTQLRLGPSASEDVARQARYAWLESVRRKYQASAIVTAHHQDDVLETMYLNIERGTGWRGLCSLRETPTRQRPLLSTSKQQIVQYAIEHSLEWRDDSTNDDLRYRRNWVRYGVMPRLPRDKRQQLVDLYESQCALRLDIESELDKLGQVFADDHGLRRYDIIMLPDDAAYEVLRQWLGQSLERARLRDLLLFAKTAKEGAKWSLDADRFVVIKNSHLIV